MVTLRIELELTTRELRTLQSAIYRHKELVGEFVEISTNEEARVMWNDDLRDLAALETKLDVASKQATDVYLRRETTHRFTFRSIENEPPPNGRLLIRFDDEEEEDGVEYWIPQRIAGVYYGEGGFAMSERELIEAGAQWALLPGQNQDEGRR